MSRKILLAAVLFLALAISSNPTAQVAQSQVRYQEITIALQDFVGAKIRANRSGVTLTEADGSAFAMTPELIVPLQNAEPFLAVAPMVTLTGTEEGLSLLYRTQQDQNGWIEWTEIQIDRDTTPRGSGKLSALLFLPQKTTKVQFQLRRQHTAHPIATSISGFKVAFINPGKTPLQDHSFPWSSNFAPRISAESSAAKYPKPLITSRTAWGCPDGQNNPRSTPSYTTVTHLIVHHTAGSNTASDWSAVVRSIWNFHIFTNGWSDIGYNYLIDPNGVIYEGRAGGDNVIGAHFSCQNSGTMGVALLGTFTSVQPSTTALNSLKEILSWKADQRSIDPSASTFHNGMQQALQNISGHRDGNGLTRSCTATECPGETLYPLLPNLRTEIKGLVNPINDFTLTTTTDQQFVGKGETVLFPINSATLAGAAQMVNLTLRNLPAGFIANFNTSAIATGNAARLSITVPENTPSGVYPVTVIATGSTNRALDLLVTVTGTVASVSAASYQKAVPVALESIVSAFGINLATAIKAAESRPLPLSLADVSLKIKDSSGTELTAPLFFVSPTQINYQVPPTLARGLASVQVFNKNEVVAVGTIEIIAAAPGLFSANANGQGAAVGALQRRQADGTDIFEPLAQFDEGQKLFLVRELDLRTQTEQFFLTLYGTGIRLRNSALPIKAQIGTTEVEVLYAGDQQEFVGLDQVNLRLTSALIGQGPLELRLQVEGLWTNAVIVGFK